MAGFFAARELTLPHGYFLCRMATILAAFQVAGRKSWLICRKTGSPDHFRLGIGVESISEAGGVAGILLAHLEARLTDGLSDR
jgi:hypothetical protein